jgi:DNA-binding MarR family transcriptional regulator
MTGVPETSDGGIVTASDSNDKGFQLALSPTHLLHRAQQLAANKSAQALRDAGLTIRQFALLEALSEQEGASQSQLVDATAIDRSTLADMVARMEKSGLITRDQASNDARAKSLTLTEEGRSALSRARPAVAEADRELLAILPKNRQGSLLAILTLMAEASDASLLDLEPETDGRKAKGAKKAKVKEKDKADARDEDATKRKKKKKKKNK